MAVTVPMAWGLLSVLAGVASWQPAASAIVAHSFAVHPQGSNNASTLNVDKWYAETASTHTQALESRSDPHHGEPHYEETHHEDPHHGEAAGEPMFRGKYGHQNDGHNPMTKVIALILFGTVAWVISMFYFVNFPDEDIQFATWCTLSQMISIFIAILIFGASTGTLIDFAGLEVHHAGTPPIKTLVVGFVRWIVAYIVLQVAFVALRDKPFKLLCFANVAGHVVGFCAIDAFGVMLHLPIFSESFWTSLLGVVWSIGVLLAVALLTQKIRTRFFRNPEWSEHKTEEWVERCDEAETESMGLAIGLLLSLMFRFVITGTLPMVHGSPRFKTDHEVLALFAVSLSLLPFVVGSSFLEDILKDMGSSEVVLWLAGILMEAFSMTAGWCTLYWGYWWYYVLMENEHGAGGMIGMRIVLAILFSAIVLFSIVAIDFAADRTESARLEKGLRSLLKMFALLMGLAWESTFAIGIESFADEFKSNLHTLVINIVVLGMCLLVLPAWSYYIVPHTQRPEKLNQSAKHAKKHSQPEVHTA